MRCRYVDFATQIEAIRFARRGTIRLRQEWEMELPEIVAARQGV